MEPASKGVCDTRGSVHWLHKGPNTLPDIQEATRQLPNLMVSLLPGLPPPEGPPWSSVFALCSGRLSLGHTVLVGFKTLEGKAGTDCNLCSHWVWHLELSELVGATKLRW